MEHDKHDVTFLRVVILVLRAEWTLLASMNIVLSERNAISFFKYKSCCTITTMSYRDNLLVVTFPFPLYASHPLLLVPVLWALENAG